MLTVKELREALKDIPGHYKIWITLPDDELPVGRVTQDRAFIRICAPYTEISHLENTLWESET